MKGTYRVMQLNDRLLSQHIRQAALSWIDRTQPEPETANDIEACIVRADDEYHLNDAERNYLRSTLRRRYGFEVWVD